jgi:hypothetical protein
MSIPSALLLRTAALCMALTVTLAAVGGAVAQDRQGDPDRPVLFGQSPNPTVSTTNAYSYENLKGRTYYSAP